MTVVPSPVPDELEEPTVELARLIAAGVDPYTDEDAATVARAYLELTVGNER